MDTLETVYVTVPGEGLDLQGYLAGAAGEAAAGRVLVVCGGFPTGPRVAAASWQTYPQLADHLADESGWSVLTFNFRGTGDSQGDFSLGGWLADLRGAVDYVAGMAGPQIWLAGFNTGGALALCLAGEDGRVNGVATFGAPARFSNWAADPMDLLAHARELGIVRSEHFPTDLAEWARPLYELRPDELVTKLPPRPVLIVHGSDDDTVPVAEARALADGASESAELRILPKAGHRLRDDPRAVAVLLGWLDRLNPRQP